MNLSETARLLGAMASFDRRTVGDGDVIAWQTVLADAPFDDCLEAVRRHYAEHTEWMMPAHVRRLVRDIEGERAAAARSTGWAPGQAGVPKDQAMPQVTGEIQVYEVPGPLLDLVTQIRAFLPAGDRAALFPRQVAWEREQQAWQRQQDAQPNPHWKPTANAYVPPPTAACPYCATSLESECPWHGPLGAALKTLAEPVAGTCPICHAESQDLAGHYADYPRGSCA